MEMSNPYSAQNYNDPPLLPLEALLRKREVVAEEMRATVKSRFQKENLGRAFGIPSSTVGPTS